MLQLLILHIIFLPSMSNVKNCDNQVRVISFCISFTVFECTFCRCNFKSLIFPLLKRLGHKLHFASGHSSDVKYCHIKLLEFHDFSSCFTVCKCTWVRLSPAVVPALSPSIIDYCIIKFMLFFHVYVYTHICIYSI